MLKTTLNKYMYIAIRAIRPPLCSKLLFRIINTFEIHYRVWFPYAYRIEWKEVNCFVTLLEHSSSFFYFELV